VDGSSLYEFVDDNPPARIDPSGTDSSDMYAYRNASYPSSGPAPVSQPAAAAPAIAPSLSGIAAAAADLAGKIWNSPNTLLWTAVGLVGVLFGGSPPVPGDNAIEFPNNPLLNGISLGTTIGNCIIYPTGVDGDKKTEGHYKNKYQFIPFRLGDHEEGHTYEGQLLGPFYLPAYGLDQLINGRASVMEEAADRHALEKEGKIPP
jgi:hypothetical protein